MPGVRGQPPRKILTGILFTLLLAGCASTEEGRQPEGQVVFRAGAAAPDLGLAESVAGPPIRRLGVLQPAFDPAWEPVWPAADRKGSGGRGGVAGFIAGMAMMQFVPVTVLFWPAAVGVVAGTTALGVLGEHTEDTTFPRVDMGDRLALGQAATSLQPDRVLRETVADALTARTGRPPIPVPWHLTWGPDTVGTNPLADARGRGADGVVELAVEAFGLAVGEETEMFGVFIRIRARVMETSGGRLRYERVLDHGPGRRVLGLPRAAPYSIELLAMDRARLFRQEMRETIVRMALILAEDPALPLAPP